MPEWVATYRLRDAGPDNGYRWQSAERVLRGAKILVWAITASLIVALLLDPDGPWERWLTARHSSSWFSPRRSTCSGRRSQNDSHRMRYMRSIARRCARCYKARLTGAWESSCDRMVLCATCHAWKAVRTHPGETGSRPGSVSAFRRSEGMRDGLSVCRPDQLRDRRPCGVFAG